MKKIVGIAFGLVAAGATIVAARSIPQTHNDRTEKSSDSSVSADGATRLRVKGMIAEVVLETSNTSQLSVHAVRWTKHPESEAAKRWMNDAHLTVRRSGDELSVVDSIDGDQSMKSLKGNMNGGLDLHIVVPRGLAVKFELGVGTAKPSGEYRSMDMSLGAGDMVGRFGLSGGSSEVHVGAGRVELNIPRGANLDVSTQTGVGQVSGLPESGEDDTNKIHMGDHRSGRFGSGGAKLSVHVGAGEIVINSGSKAQALAMSDSDEGSREQHLWSGDVDSSVLAEQSTDKTLDDLGPTIEKAIAMSQSEVDKALKQAQPEMDRDLANIGPEIEKALKEAQPDIDKAMAEIGPDVDKALKQARPEIDREMAKIGPEIEKAMKQIRPELEKARRENRHEIDKALPEVERAMKEAEKELEQAMAEVDRDGAKHSELSSSIRKAVREALAAARVAIKESMNEAKEAIKEAKKHSDD